MKLAISASLLVMCASTAHANPCTSQWMKARAQFAILAPIVAKVACDLAASGDEGAAQGCVDTYEEVKKQLESINKKWNTVAGSATIGPAGWHIEGSTRAP